MYNLDMCVYVTAHVEVFVSIYILWIELSLPVFEGWNEGWAAEGKPLVDPEVPSNASKLAKPAFALAFCDTGVGRWGSERQKKPKQTKKKRQWEET